MLRILPQCQREITEFPEEVRGELSDVLARLNEGHVLSMPLSRPMPLIGKGVHELRLKDRTGIYRIIYFLAGGGTIYLLHSFTKKTNQTPQQNIDLAKKRLKEIRR